MYKRGSIVVAMEKYSMWCFTIFDISAAAPYQFWRLHKHSFELSHTNKEKRAADRLILKQINAASAQYFWGQWFSLHLSKLLTLGFDVIILDHLHLHRLPTVELKLKVSQHLTRSRVQGRMYIRMQIARSTSPWQDKKMFKLEFHIILQLYCT